MYQTTIKVEGFITVTSEKPLNINKDVPVRLDVWDKSDNEDSKVTEVIETEVITVEKQNQVPC